MSFTGHVEIQPEEEWVTMNTADLNAQFEKFKAEIDYIKDSYDLERDCIDILNDVLNVTLNHSEDQKSPGRSKCDQCRFKTTSDKNLKTHKEMVHQLSLLHCVMCDVKVRSKEDIKKHMQKMHPKNQIFTCVECT